MICAEEPRYGEVDMCGGEEEIALTHQDLHRRQRRKPLWVARGSTVAVQLAEQAGRRRATVPS